MQVNNEHETAEATVFVYLASKMEYADMRKRMTRHLKTKSDHALIVER